MEGKLNLDGSDCGGGAYEKDSVIGFGKRWGERDSRDGLKVTGCFGLGVEVKAVRHRFCRWWGKIQWSFGRESRDRF